MRKLLIFLISVLCPLTSVLGEGSETLKLGTSTHNVQSPLTINWTGTTQDFTGATVSGLTGVGTVTSVNLTAPAAGITVSGGPITSSGSITLALANDLAALEALSGTNTIYYRSGTSAWSPVTIGSNLTFSSGTLSASGGGTPGGSNTQVQYNNSGAFGGITNATTDGTTMTLTSPAITTPTGIVKGDVGLGNVTNNAQTQSAIVPNTAPAAGQILAGNAGGTAYAPVTLSGSGATATLSSAGLLTLSAIPNATLSNSAITIAGTSTSLGGSITQDTITGLSSTGLVKRTAANTLGVITDSSSNWDTAYTDRLKWDGGSTGLTAATGRTSLGATTTGSNLFTVTDPSAITFLKVNADNSVTLENAATFRSDIGAGTGAGTVTSFSAGNLSPLFTSSVATSTTTPALTFSLSNAAATTVFGNNTGSSGAPVFSSAPEFLKIGNLTSNGFVKTGSSDGTLSIDTSTYLTGNQTVTLSGDVTGSGATAITTTLAAGSAGNLNSGTLLAARMPALTGDVTTSAGAVATTIATGAVTDAKGSLMVKPAVAVVSATNLTLSGEQTIDGQTTSTSLVLAAGQTTGSENGPWVSASGAWARPSWYTSGSTTQAPRFLTVFVRLGTTYSGTTWRMTTASVTIDTTSTTWVETPLAVNATSVSNGVTGTGNVTLATAPAIAGGTHTGITGLGIRDTSAAFDVTVAATSSTTLTAGRTLTIDMVNAGQTLKLTGSPTLSGLTTTGTGTLALGTKNLTVSNTLTLAGTDSTTMTFPTTSATIARTDAAQTFTGVQTMTSPSITTPTGIDINDLAYGNFTSGTAPTVAKGVYFVAFLSSVDLKNTGTSAVFTVPTGKTFVCQQAWAVVTAVTGAGAGTESFKITESGGGNAMTQFTSNGSSTPAVGTVFGETTNAGNGPFKTCTAGNTVNVFINTSQAGSTTVTGTVFVSGFYF